MEIYQRIKMTCMERKTMSDSLSDVVVIDGGLATELSKQGFSIDDDPLWSARLLATDPKSLKQVHLSYLKNGADVITTASYQASINGFKEYLHLSEEKAKELIASSVAIAQEAKAEYIKHAEEEASKGVENAYFKRSNKEPLIAGSVGPYGASLHDGSEYTGNYVDSMTVEELIEWHRPRLQCLVEAGADLIAMETIPAAKEGIALMRLLHQFPGVKAWLSFTCKDSKFTSHGEDLKSTVQTCVHEAPSELVAIGVNCCHPDNVEQYIKDIKSVAHNIPAIAYPNRGETWISGQGWIGEGSRKDFGTYVESWTKNGAKWIGGCCRTTPSDIAAMKTFLISNI